jgi:hypothetical protein
MNIQLDTTKGMGFGDQLCMLSFLCSLPETITLYSNNVETYYERLKKLIEILDIPDYKLKIEESNYNGDFYGAYHFKILNDYYYPEFLNLKGRKVKVKDNSRSRPCVGLCLYNGPDGYVDTDKRFVRNQPFNLEYEPDNSHRAPQCKWRTIDYYGKVMMKIRQLGYDVVTLDAHSNLENKIEYLVENCCAVIGYEGGVAHLCHMLQIPYLMFSYTPNAEDLPFGLYTMDVIHQSKTCYFLRDDNEILNMDLQQFRQLISNLEQGKNNNNLLLNNKIKMGFQKGYNSSIIFSSDQGTEYVSVYGPQVSKSVTNLIHRYYPEKFPRLHDN